MHWKSYALHVYKLKHGLLPSSSYRRRVQSVYSAWSVAVCGTYTPYIPSSARSSWSSLPADRDTAVSTRSSWSSSPADRDTAVSTRSSWSSSPADRDTAVSTLVSLRRCLLRGTEENGDWGRITCYTRTAFMYLVRMNVWTSSIYHILDNTVTCRLGNV